MLSEHDVRRLLAFDWAELHVLRVEAARLAHVNELDDMAIFTLPDGYVAAEGDVVARAKIVPFVAREDRVAAAEALSTGGLLTVDAFLPTRVALVADEDVRDDALGRARRAFEEKLAFFGA